LEGQTFGIGAIAEDDGVLPVVGSIDVGLQQETVIHRDLDVPVCLHKLSVIPGRQSFWASLVSGFTIHS
jgi:hypothetical protein